MPRSVFGVIPVHNNHLVTSSDVILTEHVHVEMQISLAQIAFIFFLLDLKNYVVR